MTPQFLRSSSNIPERQCGDTMPSRYETAEATAWWEKNLLGALWLQPSLWKEVSALRPENFLLTEHREIFAAIREINTAGEIADVVSIVDQLSRCRSLSFDIRHTAAYLFDCEFGCVPENIKRYTREVQRAARERKYRHLCERLPLCEAHEREGLLAEALELAGAR
jgi:replicative DNA helicase